MIFLLRILILLPLQKAFFFIHNKNETENVILSRLLANIKLNKTLELKCAILLTDILKEQDFERKKAVQNYFLYQYPFVFKKLIIEPRKYATQYSRSKLYSQVPTLGQKSSIYPKIRILKISLFTKFTISGSHFTQNSHFQNLIFHKIHKFKI